MVSTILALRKIYINKTHRSKTLHLLMEINNYVVEGLMDTRASMFAMATIVIRELGIMHLVTGFKTYKTASRVVTQALGRIDEVPVKVGGIQCIMTYMVVDINSYDVLLGLDFLIKIGAIVDTGTNSNEHCDGELHQFEQINDEDEFRDTELEDLVMAEGS